MSKSKNARGRTNMADTMMTCALCDESFDSEYELRNHQQIAHAAEIDNRRRSRMNEPDEDEQETAA